MPHVDEVTYAGSFGGAGSGTDVDEEGNTFSYTVTTSGALTAVLTHNADGTVTGTWSYSGTYNSSAGFSGPVGDSGSVTGTPDHLVFTSSGGVFVNGSGTLSSDGTTVTFSAGWSFDGGGGSASGSMVGDPGAPPTEPVPPANWTEAAGALISPTISFDGAGNFVMSAVNYTQQQLVDVIVPEVAHGLEYLMYVAGQAIGGLGDEFVASFNRVSSTANVVLGVVDNAFNLFVDSVNGYFDGTLNAEQVLHNLHDTAVEAQTEAHDSIEEQIEGEANSEAFLERLFSWGFSISLPTSNPSTGAGTMVMTSWLGPPTVGGGFNQVSGVDSTTLVMGGATNEHFTMGSQMDIVSGGAGDDLVEAGGGNDIVHGGAGADTVQGGAGDDVLMGADGDDVVQGGQGSDVIIGGSGAGNDTYDGGDGVDTVSYASATQTVTVNLSAASNHAVGVDIGTDQITGVENVRGGSGADTITGNGAANALSGGGGGDTLFGVGGDDILDGGAGVDTMVGGDGDDTYVVDNAGDVTTETSAAGGVDTVQSSVTRTLGANLENLILTGAAAVNGFGNALNNVITGNSAANQLNGFDGNDILDGGGAADSMFGGNGDDIYYVDNTGDLTTEVSALGGTDTVISSVNRNLTAHIENLTLTGSANLTGAGNSLNNILIGNTGANTLYGFAGNDVLDGGAGADTLFGAAGDDTYYVDNVGDITVEGLTGAAGGVDTVISSIDRNLNANFENLTLTGTAQFGYGNILGNVMAGNAVSNSLYGFDGNDTLNGMGGADLMFGGNGDDTYIVDNAGDVTSEASAAGGIDTVMSSVTRNLTANLENLVLTGADAINGAGNALNNVITGNSAANTLYGLDGADRLDGGLGADTLQGGPGADTYVFSSALGAGNVDTIIGFSVIDDTIELASVVFAGLGPGALAASAFHVGAAAADADDRIIYNSATGALYFDADGNGAGAAVQFATLAAGLALTSADFIVGGP